MSDTDCQPLDGFITVTAAAGILKCTPNNVRWMLETHKFDVPGEVNVRRRGRHLWIRKSAVLAQIKDVVA